MFSNVMHLGRRRQSSRRRAIRAQRVRLQESEAKPFPRGIVTPRGGRTAPPVLHRALRGMGRFVDGRAHRHRLATIWRRTFARREGVFQDTARFAGKGIVSPAP